jgi:hypothetical protein
MWPASRPSWYGFLAVIVLGVLAETATAERLTPPADSTKVRTLSIRPQWAEDHGDLVTSPATSLKFHTLKVRPRLPGEQRDASGREYSATPIPDDAEPIADPHTVRTIPVRPEPNPAGDPDHHTVRTIPVPSQPVPQ